MAWIRVIQPPEADEKLRGAYDEVGAARGTVANIMKIHSVSPDVMSAHLVLALGLGVKLEASSGAASADLSAW